MGGYKVIGEPRTTGDGYYESVIPDPENNIIEITI
jgi:lactoylglutathione lyase